MLLADTILEHSVASTILEHILVFFLKQSLSLLQFYGSKCWSVAPSDDVLMSYFLFSSFSATNDIFKLGCLNYFT